MEVQTLRNRPDQDLDATEMLLMEHFGILTQQRPPAFSKVPAAIPITQIESFYRVYDVGEYMSLPEFCDTMMELDKVVLEHYQKESDREKAKKAK